MKKYKSVIIILNIILILLLFGCATAKDKLVFEESAYACVENDKDKLIELYDIFVDNNIDGINKLDKEDNLKEGHSVGFKNNYYYIRTSEVTLNDSIKLAYIRACEIVDYLMSEYAINDIYYYSNFNYIEFTFDENYFNVDWYVLYYPSGVVPEMPEKDFESYKEIKDGFCIYYFYPGF